MVDSSKNIKRVAIMGSDALVEAVAVTLADRGYLVSVIDSTSDALSRFPTGKIGPGEIVSVLGDATFARDQQKGWVHESEVFMALSPSDTRNAMAATVAKSIHEVALVISRIEDPILQEMYNGLGIRAIGSNAIVADMAVKVVD